MSVVAIVIALFFAVVLCLLGEVLRMSLPGLKRILIPGAVLGGALALCFGPQVLDYTSNMGLSEDSYEVLGRFPPMFINVVFAALMLGRPIEKFSKIWQRARPQIVMGHVYAWGQYVVGLSLVLFVIGPLWSTDELAGPAIAIGFQGGHGTAAGLDATFESLGYADGKTVAYALATFGIVVGTVLGPLLANFQRSRAENQEDEGQPKGEEISGGSGKPDNEAEDEHPVELSPLTGSLTVHLAMIGVIILIAYGVLQGTALLESSLRTEAEQLYTEYIPLFSVVLIVGFGLQLLLQTLKVENLVHRGTVDNISAFALDMVIFGALATLSLEVVGQSWQTIAVLCAGGLTWNLAVYFGLGPRMYPKPWYAFGLGDLGGGTATTASGLLLIRVADPDDKTEGRLAYTEKQPFYEPFMGGGLVTAFALPIVANVGAGVSLGITGGVLAAWLIFAFWLIHKS